MIKKICLRFCSNFENFNPCYRPVEFGIKVALFIKINEFCKTSIRNKYYRYYQLKKIDPQQEQNKQNNIITFWLAKHIFLVSQNLLYNS